MPAQTDLKETVEAISVNPDTLKIPPLKGMVFNAADGLDMTEIATLAVVNNPQLKTERDNVSVARAQLLDARLLPDPQFSLSADRPTDQGPGLTDAYGVGLNYNLARILSRGARVDAADASKAQVQLNLMWKEWQVAQQARSIYVNLQFLQKKRRLLQRVQSMYAQRYSHSARALKQGNLTLDVAGTDLTALLDVNTRLSQTKQAQNKARHDLNKLLGLAPEARPVLTAGGRAQTPEDVEKLLETIAQRRPDLLALRAGYQSQEARIRQAILAQFPSISVGISRARDTSDVHTTGLSLSLNLPLFNGNRGQIAVQRATRSQLHQAYQARLDETKGNVDMLRNQFRLQSRQLKRVKSNLPELERMVDLARAAYESRDIGALTYLNMQNTLVSKQIEQANLEKSTWDTRIALDTLLGASSWDN